jgi:bifunctional non-homologous end joining protein LigD
MFKAPMLCLRREEFANQEGWCYEIKYDGERAKIVVKKGGGREIYARSGREKNRMYPDLDVQVKIPCELDGEIVAKSGKFNDIQHRANRENGIAEAAKFFPVMFQAFDVTEIDGQDVTGYSLQRRKDWLTKLIVPTATCVISPIYTDGEALYRQVEVAKGEGIIGKRLSSTYQYGARCADWFKKKVPQREILWVMGYTDGTGNRQSTFGAMILARYETNKFRYVGKVGTGFDYAELEILFAKMQTPGTQPFSMPEKVTWCQPFQVEIECLEFTASGAARFPSYKGRI